MKKEGKGKGKIRFHRQADLYTFSLFHSFPFSLSYLFTFHMQTIEHLRELFRYNDWANRRIIVALKTGVSERSLQILAHLLITEAEYYERLYGKDSTGFNFWPNLTLADCGELAKATAEGRPDAVTPLLGETVEIDDQDIPDADGHDSFHEWQARWNESWDSWRVEDVELLPSGEDKQGRAHHHLLCGAEVHP